MTAVSLASLVLRSRNAAFSVLILLVILALGVAFLYRRQTRQTRLRWRLILLALRLAAICALVLSILQPVSVRRARPREQGAVVIVIDHSHSMSIRDYEGHPDQTVALADGLGLLKPDTRSRGDEWVAMAAQLNQCAADLSDAQSALAFARISGRNTSDTETQVAQTTLRFDSAVQTLLSRRPALNPKSSLAKAIDDFKNVLQLPRNLENSDFNDTGEDWLPTVRSSLASVAAAAATFQLESDQALYRSNPQVKAICDVLARSDRLGLVEMAMTQPRTGLLASLSQNIPLYGFAAGDRLTQLPLRGPPLGQGTPVRHLVLDTDALGMNLTDALRTATQRLSGVPIRSIVLFSTGRQPLDPSYHFDDATLGHPVLAVCAAAPQDAPDIPEGQLTIGSLAFPATVVAGQQFTVTTRAQGINYPRATPQEFSCRVDAVDKFPAQSESLTPAGTDLAFLLQIDQPGPHKISVGLPAIGGAERWINVINRPLHVALEAREPKWDWRIARRNVERDAAFTLRADTFADRPVPLTPQEILQQDAIVLFDAQRQSLSALQLKSVEEWVRQRRGLLIFVGAISHDTDSLAQSSIIRELLPMTIAPPDSNALSEKSESAASSGWQVWPGSQSRSSIIPAPQAQAMGSPFADWQSVPAVFRYFPAEPLKPAAEPLLIESNSKSVVAAEKPFGAGHVIFIGLDELWRWRASNPQTADSFWPSLLRHFTPPPYAMTDGRLSLDAPASIVSKRPLDVRLKYVDASGSPTSASVTVTVRRQQVQVSQETPMPATNGEWSANFAGLPPGDYQIQAIADDSKEHRSVTLPLRVLPEFENEYQNAAAGRDTLTRLTETSRGRLLQLDQVRQLPGLLDQAALTPTVAVSLWDSGYLFAFVVACLCAEWALRKRIGLA